jgi:hypothetical protein
MMDPSDTVHLSQSEGPDHSSSPPLISVLYHGAEGGAAAAVCRHGVRGVAVSGGVRLHQEGTAVDGVLPLLGGHWHRDRWRWGVCHGIYHVPHLTRDHLNSMACC